MRPWQTLNIDAAQKAQYAALTTKFPSMVAQILSPDHPGTEVAPSRLCWMLHWSALRRSSHLEPVTSRRDPNWFEADRERAALNKAIARREKDAAALGRACSRSPSADEADLLKVVNNRKCSSAPGETGTFADVYSQGDMCVSAGGWIRSRLGEAARGRPVYLEDRESGGKPGKVAGRLTRESRATGSPARACAVSRAGTAAGACAGR
jgi:hypothetical protein